MIYRNGIYYDKMIRNGVVYDRMVRNGVVYGDVQSGGFNWEIGINLSEQGRTDDVPGWNNIRKPTGPQTVGPSMEWSDLLDINGVNTGAGLALTQATHPITSNSLSASGTFPDPNAYVSDWRSSSTASSSFTVSITGLDTSKIYQIRVIPKQTGQASYTIDDTTVSVEANRRPTTSDWDDPGYVIFDGISSADGTISIRVTAPSGMVKSILAIRIREYNS
jgi:hypothetical protein